MSARHILFNSMVKSCHQDLYRLAYWLCRCSDVAEDLVQETYLRAWKNLDQLQDLDKAKPWLMRILQRENARRFERKQLDTVEWKDDSVSINSNAEEIAEHQLLRTHIARLPNKYREPLVLQLMGDMSCKEIGKLMNLPENTVVTRIRRARLQLAEIVKPAEQNMVSK